MMNMRTANADGRSAIRIDSVKRNQGKASLYLSNGIVINMPRAMLRERPYRSGTEFDPNAHSAFMQTRSYAFALDKAISLLASRNRTEKEIVTSLRRNAYPEDTICRVMERLTLACYVNDTSFAGHWAQTRVSKGLGLRRIQMELKQKGVEQDAIEEAVSAIDGDMLFDSALKAAQKAARGKNLSIPSERQKVLAALARRGFDFSLSKRALQHIQSEE